MTINFKKAFKDLIGIEGGYVNDPDDRGGETKYGISKRSYPHLDIKNLTLEQAQEIYYRDFWFPALEKEYPIAAEVFDTAVNMGKETAIKILQEALNLMNRNQHSYSDVIVDGALGPRTLSSYRNADKNTLLKVLNGLQFMRYVEICRRNPSQEKYFNGWMKRV